MHCFSFTGLKGTTLLVLMVTTRMRKLNYDTKIVSGPQEDQLITNV